MKCDLDPKSLYSHLSTDWNWYVVYTRHDTSSSLQGTAVGRYRHRRQRKSCTDSVTERTVLSLPELLNAAFDRLELVECHCCTCSVTYVAPTTTTAKGLSEK